MLKKRDTLLLRGRYEEIRPEFARLARQVQEEIGIALSTRALRHMVTSRAKSPASLERKLWKERKDWALEDFDEGFSPPLKDLAGARVLLYLKEDVETAVESIVEHFKTSPFPAMLSKAYTQTDGYRATHLHAQSMAANGSGGQCEIQVCTITDHVWNELEHDIVYKQPGGKPDDAQRELLLTLNRSLSMAAETASRLMTRTNEKLRTNQKTIDGPDALRLYLEGHEQKVLNGDYAALYSLLNGLMNAVTPKGLDQYLYAEPYNRQELMASIQLLDPDEAHQDLAGIVVRLLPHLGGEAILELVNAMGSAPALLKFACRAATLKATQTSEDA